MALLVYPWTAETPRVDCQCPQLCAIACLHVARTTNRSHTMLAVLATPACSCAYPCSPRPALSGTLLPGRHKHLVCLLLQRRRSRCRSLVQPYVLLRYHVSCPGDFLPMPHSEDAQHVDLDDHCAIRTVARCTRAWGSGMLAADQPTSMSYSIRYSTTGAQHVPDACPLGQIAGRRCDMSCSKRNPTTSRINVAIRIEVLTLALTPSCFSSHWLARAALASIKHDTSNFISSEPRMLRLYHQVWSTFHHAPHTSSGDRGKKLGAAASTHGVLAGSSSRSTANLVLIRH
jgi:hypothetical protein